MMNQNSSENEQTDCDGIMQSNTLPALAEARRISTSTLEEEDSGLRSLAVSGVDSSKNLVPDATARGRFPPR